MPQSLTQHGTPVGEKAEKFLRLLTESLGMSGIEIRLWDGTSWRTSHEGIPKITLIFHDPYAVRRMFLQPSSLSFGEGYINGAFDVEGDMNELFALADDLTFFKPSLYQKSRYLHYLLAIPQEQQSEEDGWNPSDFTSGPGSSDRIQKAINFHYDLPIEFWRPWLDQSMTYSCAYFRSPEASLDTAQADKLDYICRKLDLRSGERFLDMGCGWGSLVIHAAKQYGVQALGVTLSPKQAEFAQTRIRQLGLQEKAHVKILDFLDMNDEGSFDKIASVGAIEHVPEAQLLDYFSRANALLKPNGVFFNQGITRNPTRPMRPGREFLDKFVFPDHHLATIGETLSAAEQAGMEVRDVENLREHYVSTLNHWRYRLESHQSIIEQVTSPKTYRIFKLYLAGTAYEMLKGRVHVHQSLFMKPGAALSAAPKTREAWYVDVSRQNRPLKTST